MENGLRRQPSNDICPICLEEAPQDAVVCPCPGAHVFCNDCLAASKALCCPLCRNRSEPVVRFLFSLQRPGQCQEDWMIDQLLESVMQGNLQIMRILVEWNCPVNIAENDVQPLHIAAQEGHMEVAQFLVEARASVEASDTEEGATPLGLAAFEGHLEMVQFLVQVRAQLDRFDGEYLTPFMTACSGGHVEVAAYLLAAHSDPQKCSVWGFTALHIAVEDMCTEVCQWLLRVAQGVVVNALAQYDETILHIAGRMDHWEVIDMMQNPFGRALVDAKTSTGFSALHFACAMGNLNAVDSLLRLRADLNARTAHEVTPLHLATENGHVVVVKFLLLMSAKLNIPCNCFPVHHSLLDWHLPRDSANVLNVQVGARVSFNLAEFQHCPGSQWVSGILEGVELDPDSQDRFDDTLMINTGDITCGVSRYHCMPHLTSTLVENRYVIKNGEAVYIKAPIYCSSGDWILVPGDVGKVVAIYSSGEYEIEGLKDNTNSRYLATRDDLIPFLQEDALHCACRHGHLEIVKELLEAHADLAAGPRTALHCAAQSGHVEVVEALLAARADIDAQWLVSNSALETAVLAGQEALVAHLLRIGATQCSRRPVEMLAESTAAARSAGQSTELLVSSLLVTMTARTKPELESDDAGPMDDLWLDRNCLLQLRDLGMDCLLKGDEASAVGISEFLGRVRCCESAHRSCERMLAA